MYYGGQKILAVNFCYLKKNCKLYFIVIMITVLIMIGIFWAVNFKHLEIILSCVCQNFIENAANILI
jgi:hypothetical protein